jgi:hypothetical protein
MTGNKGVVAFVVTLAEGGWKQGVEEKVWAMREEVRGMWRKLHNEKPFCCPHQMLCGSSNPEWNRRSMLHVCGKGKVYTGWCCGNLRERDHLEDAGGDGRVILTLILLMWKIGRAPNSIPIYIQQEATLHSLFISGNCSTCSGGTSTYHQERIQLYLQHLIFVTPLLLSAAIVEEMEPVWVCCGWPTPPTAHSNRFQLFHDSVR